MAWLGIIIIILFMDTQDHAIIMSGSIFFLPPMSEKKNHLVLSWDQTQVLLLHTALTTRPDHAASRIKIEYIDNSCLSWMSISRN